MYRMHVLAGVVNGLVVFLWCASAHMCRCVCAYPGVSMLAQVWCLGGQVWE